MDQFYLWDYDKALNPKNLNDMLKAIYNLIFPINYILITSENKNPSSELGGEWELVDKEFKETVVNNPTNKDDYFVKTVALSSFNIHTYLKGHTLTLILNMTTAQIVDDSTIELGTIQLEKLGIKSFVYTYQLIPAPADNGNGILMIAINASGRVQSMDVVANGNNTNLPTNTTAVMYTTFVISHTNMLDDFCDKFYWKRVA